MDISPPKENLLLLSWSNYDSAVTSAFNKYLASKVKTISKAWELKIFFLQTKPGKTRQTHFVINGIGFLMSYYGYNLV